MPMGCCMRAGAEFTELQEQIRDVLTPLDADDEDSPLAIAELAQLLAALGWDDTDLGRDPEILEAYSRYLHDLQESLAPTAVIIEDGTRCCWCRSYQRGNRLDQKGQSDAAGVAGLRPKNGLNDCCEKWALSTPAVSTGCSSCVGGGAPKGESSGYLTFPLANWGRWRGGRC